MNRKDQPIFSGVIKYFPKALRYVSEVSKEGNDQHNPDKPLHWDRSKSGDELDALARHLVDRAEGNIFDEDGIRHAGKIAWRSLANLEKELENYERIKSWRKELEEEPIGTDCQCELGSDRHYHPNCKYR